MSKRIVIAAFLVALAAFEPAGQALAQPRAGQARQLPTTSDPHMVLPVLFERQLGEKRKAAIELCKPTSDEAATTARRSIPAALEKAEALAQQGKIKQVSGLEIETINLKIIELQRLAEHLEGWGELAGTDLTKRATGFQIRLNKLAELRVEDKEFVAPLNKRLKKLHTDLQAAHKKLPDVTRLVELQQPEAAQKLYWRLTDGIEQGTIWYGLKGMPLRPSWLNSLDPFRNACAVAALKLWRKQALDICKKQLAEATPDYSGLIQQCDQAAAAIGKGPTADIEGEKLSGPDAVTALGQRWRQLDLATQHARGWAWYSNRLGGPDPRGALTAAQLNQGRNVAAALGRLIAAQAASAKPEQVAALHQEYLTRLTPLMLLSGDPAVLAALEQGLGVLAAKSPALGAEVLAYQNATSEPLRWRERIVSAVAAARGGPFPPINQLARKHATPLRDNQGPLMIHDRGMVICRWTGPIPEMIGRLDAMKGKDTMAAELLRVAPDKTMTIGDYRQPMRCYVSVPTGVNTAAAAVLTAELLSSPAHLPLTLEGRAALAAAQQGDLMAAGGPILRLGLAAWGEHFATLSAKQRGAARLNPIAGDFVEGNEMVVLVQIDAQWIAGRHYIVNVPKQAAEIAPSEKVTVEK